VINKKTVLVLGAGASQPYNFPTGAGLVKIIASDFSSPRVVRIEKMMPREYRILVDELRRAHPYSIDEFLENHPSLADMGRMAIAFHLLPAEYESQAILEDVGKTDHWYRYLKAAMGGPLTDFGKNSIRIITFNYDRSLEYYLYRTLRSSYEQMDESRCVEILRQIPVLHIYGSLGPLQWQSSENAVRYGDTPERSLDDIRIASQNIKILHEGNDDTVQRNFATARSWLGWAERVLFMGFGFHPSSVERLALSGTLRSDQDIRATCKGLDATRIDAIAYCAKWATRPSHVSGTTVMKFPDPEADCYTFLHDHVILS